MADDRPNILLIMTDQQRGDCLGVDGHPLLQTPYLDHLAASGVRFSNGYSACPVCTPARRTVLTGRKPSRHGVLVNHKAPLPWPTLARELNDAGYQTHLVGKSHWGPSPNEVGFDSYTKAGGPRHPGPGEDNEYQAFLRENGVTSPRASDAHGCYGNGYPSRPWHLEERLHFSNWVADRTIDLIDNRDPDRPFFIWANFIHPHQPLTPPQFYYDKYMAMDLPEPVVGDWSRVFDEPVRGLEPEPWRISVEPAVMKQIRAAYYGCIEHIDHQIARMTWHGMLPENTVIAFASDHGEMLGDHQWFRKRNPLEPSARVPYLFKFPKSMYVPQEQVIDKPVELMDLMPTFLDVAGLPIPETVDGSSLLPLVRDAESDWRGFVHGECCNLPSANSGMQYVTDGKRKFAWLPGRGEELFFDLEQDPNELNNLIDDNSRAREIAVWRGHLIAQLVDRPEGFTDGSGLNKLDGPTTPVLQDVITEAEEIEAAE
ncbi:TPA: arylsulfatase [Candidatus Latescibacteria bacterium]|nr:arylsulfatase [Candidatus Latescibacterota bacterium]